MKHFLLLIALGFSFLVSAQDYYQENVGIQLYSLRNQFKKDVPGTLKLIKDWGITSIEGGDTYGMDETEFMGLLKENGLKTISIGAGYEAFRDNPEEVVAKAKRYGAKYAMCAWIPHNGDDFTLWDIDQATKIFNRAGKVLAEQGITMVYHPHGYEFRPYEDGTLFDKMAREAEHFDFEMDVYWVQHGGEDPVALLEKYPNKFKTFHLKDMAKGTKGNNTGHEDVETNVVLGTGMVDIEKLVLRGKELGVEYMFIEDESSNVVFQIPKSLMYLTQVLR